MKRSTKNKRRSAMGTDVDPRAIFARIEREPLVVVEKGKRKKVSTLEAMVRKQWAAAMGGDARAVRQIIKWSNDFLELPRSNQIPIRVVPNDYFERRRNHG
jgi:Family of unknown function (DUF5681)